MDSSSAAENSLIRLSSQFQDRFDDLLKHLKEQQLSAAAAANAAESQREQAERMSQYLTSSVQDMQQKLIVIQQEVAEQQKGQVQLSRSVLQVLESNAKLNSMVNTLLMGTHNIPTLAIILPEVSKSWLGKANPLRIVRSQYRLLFLCSHTHMVARCGPKGKGYKITVTKQWVQDAAPVLVVGLALLKLALLAGGIPLPIPDITPLLLGNHAKYLDAALHMVLEPANVEGEGELVLGDVSNAANSMRGNEVLRKYGTSEGLRSLQEGSRKAYETIKELLEADKTNNIALTCGLRQVTHQGKTAWVMDNDEAEQAWKESI